MGTNPLNLDSPIDFANRASEQIGRYRIKVTLSPALLMADDYDLNPLSWCSIQYGDEEIHKVPDNKRGVYAFAVCQQSEVLPPHGYVLYIGIAGKDSDRPLRERYKDYLNNKKIMKRTKIAMMIGNWRQVLRFFYAPVDDAFPTEALQKLERQLNTALLPPYSDRDMVAEVRDMRRAFV